MLSTILLLSMFACFGSPCQRYVSAVNDCDEERDSDAEDSLSGSYCSDFDETSDNYFTCLTAAYEDGDCSTESGVSEIDAAVAKCTL